MLSLPMTSVLPLGAPAHDKGFLLFDDHSGILCLHTCPNWLYHPEVHLSPRLALSLSGSILPYEDLAAQDFRDPSAFHNIHPQVPHTVCCCNSVLCVLLQLLLMCAADVLLLQCALCAAATAAVTVCCCCCVLLQCALCAAAVLLLQ